MMKRKSCSMFMALALSLIMVVGLLPISAMAAGKREITGIEVWTENSTTQHPWAPSHIFVEGEPLYVMVQATRADGSTEFLSAEELDFTIVGDSVGLQAEDTGVLEGQIRIRPLQPLLTDWFYIKAALKANTEISGACSVQIDELVVRSVVVGQENRTPIVKRGQSLQLSYEIWPQRAETKLNWENWQKDFPGGKIGSDSKITKDGQLRVGWNETESSFCVFPPISDGLQPVRYNASAPTIIVETGTASHSHTWDNGSITKNATCTAEGERTFRCTDCKEVLRKEPIAKLPHRWNSGVITTPATQKKEGVRTFTCKRCNATSTESISKRPVTSGNTDAKFLQERAAEILRDGLNEDNLRLGEKTLTLVLDGREFVLSTNAKNRNISGEIVLGGGYCLRFDIKGNGSNVKEFKIFQK